MSLRFINKSAVNAGLLWIIVAAAHALVAPTAAARASYAYTIIASTGPQFRFLGAPSLNNNGVTAFRAGYQGRGEGVFTGSGGEVRTVADTSGPFSVIWWNPSINDVGTVAFKADFPNGRGIFTARADGGGTFTTIADISGPFRSVSDFTAINNHGTVAFQALLDSGGRGIYTGTGGSITTIADTSSPFNDFTTAPSINNSGTMAFFATLSVVQ